MVLVALFYNGKITLKKLTNQQKKVFRWWNLIEKMMKVILRKILNRIYIYLNIKPKLPMYILLGENTDKKTKPNKITKNQK